MPSDPALPPPGRSAASVPGRMGTTGVATMVLGAVALLLSFRMLAWYGSSGPADSAGRTDFADLHTLTKTFEAPATAEAYFHWLAWVLLIALIIVGLLANLPTRAAPALRALGLALGIGGAGVTYYTLSVLHDALREHGGSGGVFDNAQLGLWCALGGFVIAGIGAAIGPVLDD